MCSPNLHAQISVKALGIGKHVLCDKPAGLCQNEALKMVHAAHLRFLPTFIRMKEEISKGTIGDLTLIDVQVRMGSLIHEQYDWLCDASMGGGTLALVGSHVIDLIKHLTNKKAQKVHAIIKTFIQTTQQINGIRHISSPDFCTFQMELEGGCTVTANLNNHLNGSFSQEILVCGTKGHLLAKGCDLIRFCEKDEILYSDTEVFNFPTDSSLPIPYLKGLYKMIGALKEAFLPVEDKTGWVKGPVADAASFEDGLYVQAVINALKKSSMSKKWIKVDIINEEPDPNPIISAAVRSSIISS
ncbi:oxidoreductase, putative [Pediculus humanus corporis]|uniref:Oxidoreductase, putative n=1 Tax=Pediculus humanus subsp. corporis TaxID=121224 RepID=E0VMF3_PEDHC|nr:oxidoreductase, putative [Pediculus humanus corporis]EEB14559.1 oxidoreductase, putative [Pediculus humanus corporis]